MTSHASPISSRLRVRPLLEVEQAEVEDPGTVFTHHAYPKLQTIEENTAYFNKEMKALEKLRVVRLQQEVQNDEHERYQTLSFYPSTYAWGNLFEPEDCKTSILIGSAPINLQPFYEALLAFSPTKLFMLTNFTESKMLAKRYFPLCEGEPAWLTRAALRYEQQAIFEQLHGKMSFGVGAEDVEVDVSTQIWGKNTISPGICEVRAQFVSGSENVCLDVTLHIHSEARVLDLPLHATLEWKDFGTSDEAISHEDMFRICKAAIGERVACHCSAGLGRASVFACCLILTERRLKRREITYEDVGNVVEELRRVRSPGAVEKDYQFKYILEYSDFINTQQIEL